MGVERGWQRGGGDLARGWKVAQEGGKEQPSAQANGAKRRLERVGKALNGRMKCRF